MLAFACSEESDFQAFRVLRLLGAVTMRAPSQKLEGSVQTQHTHLRQAQQNCSTDARLMVYVYCSMLAAVSCVIVPNFIRHRHRQERVVDI